jgi:2-C-methyl-D-erythritol 2,4-cyclodiphosphate synthase
MGRIRVGHGYDLHRLEVLEPAGTAKPLTLGGVVLEHDRGVVAHSDGDALYHAVTDAILGAMALPDIGQLFPDTDPIYKSADSATFLRAAAQRVHEMGWRIVNIDATVILEKPKLAGRKAEMRTNIAKVLAMRLEDVNVKGKTHEKVDAVGEGRAVEVHAVVLLQKEDPRD